MTISRSIHGAERQTQVIVSYFVVMMKTRQHITNKQKRHLTLLCYCNHFSRIIKKIVLFGPMTFFFSREEVSKWSSLFTTLKSFVHLILILHHHHHHHFRSNRLKAPNIHYNVKRMSLGREKSIRFSLENTHSSENIIQVFIDP